MLEEFVRLACSLKWWEIYLAVCGLFALNGLFKLSSGVISMRIYFGDTKMSDTTEEGSALCSCFLFVYYFVLWPLICAGNLIKLMHRIRCL